MLIPQDVLRRTILRVLDTTDNPSIELIYKTAMYGKSIGYDVIIEGILNKAKYGKMLQKLIKDFNGVSYVYYLDVSFQETLRRHNTKPNHTEFDEKEMREWWVEKDHLEVEGEKEIPESTSEVETLKIIMRDLH